MGTERTPLRKRDVYSPVAKATMRKDGHQVNAAVAEFGARPNVQHKTEICRGEPAVAAARDMQERPQTNPAQVPIDCVQVPRANTVTLPVRGRRPTAGRSPLRKRELSTTVCLAR